MNFGGDQYYESTGDEVEGPYQQLQSQIEAPFIGEHVKDEEIFGTLTKSFWISLPADSTYESLAANHRNGYQFKLPEEVNLHLRHVTRATDRHMPGENDVDGELSKALFLKARVIAHKNDGVKDLNLNVQGLVPSVMTEHGRANWVIPANTPYTVVNKDIFDPTNYFTRHMYEKNAKCDLRTLKEHIRLDYDPQKQICVMPTNGIGWKVLLDNIAKDNLDPHVVEAIVAKNAAIFQNPENPHVQLAQVPYDIGEHIFQCISGPLKEIEKAYVNMKTWDVRLQPTNRLPWNHLAGVVRETVGIGADANQQEAEAAINKPLGAGVLLEITYVLNN
jgi:hypothetical protein